MNIVSAFRTRKQQSEILVFYHSLTELSVGGVESLLHIQLAFELSVMSQSIHTNWFHFRFSAAFSHNHTDKMLQNLFHFHARKRRNLFSDVPVQDLQRSWCDCFKCANFAAAVLHISILPHARHLTKALKPDRLLLSCDAWFKKKAFFMSSFTLKTKGGC